jgi:hypothetical protein
MSFHPSRRASVLPTLVVGLTLLVLGAVAHLGHHLLDPACADGGSSAHPCVCSVLHGAALAAADVEVGPSAPSPSIELCIAVHAAPTVSPWSACAARAPPLA